MKLVIDPNELRPLVRDIVSEILATLPLSDEPRLGWREDEAARLLGMAPHQLRDRRLEGRIRGTKLGRSWYYTRDELIQMLAPEEQYP